MAIQVGTSTVTRCPRSAVLLISVRLGAQYFMSWLHFRLSGDSLQGSITCYYLFYDYRWRMIPDRSYIVARISYSVNKIFRNGTHLWNF